MVSNKIKLEGSDMWGPPQTPEEAAKALAEYKEKQANTAKAWENFEDWFANNLQKITVIHMGEDCHDEMTVTEVYNLLQMADKDRPPKQYGSGYVVNVDHEYQLILSVDK